MSKVIVVNDIGTARLAQLGGEVIVDKQKENMAAAMALSMMTGMTGALVSPTPKEKEPKKPMKCTLPGCDVPTTHNGGYCKAEHCKEHQRLIREARQKAKAEKATV